MKKISNIKVKNLLVAIIALVVVLISLFVTVAKLSPHEAPDDLNTPSGLTKNPSPIELVADSPDTTNWETYTNTNLGFTIKYPDGYKVDETTGSVVIYKGEKLKTQPGSPIDPYPIDTTISLLDRGSNCGDCSGFTLEEVNLAGYRGQKVLDRKNFNDVYLYNKGNTRVYRVGYGFDPELQQILSTFRFNN